MRHRKTLSRKGKGTVRSRGVLQQQARVLIQKGSLMTTIGRAKQLRPYVERLVTASRTNTIATRRHLFKYLQDDVAVRRLLESIGPRYKERPGGYTSIVRVGRRQGDNAVKVKISFVEVQDDAKSKTK